MLSERISEIHGQLDVRVHSDVRREEYLDYMTYQANDRPLFTEIFGPLLGLKEEWRAHGASESEIDLSAFRFRSPMGAGVAVNSDIVDPLPESILHEDDESLVGRDGYGRTVKLSKKAATLPIPMDHPVKTMDDWRAFKHRFAYRPDRFMEGWLGRACASVAGGAFLSVALPGAFDTPRGLMGEEALCVAYYEDPELVHDIIDTITDLSVRILEHATAHIVVDQASVHEDMAGKSGPLAGPRQVAEFIAPYYRRIREVLDARGGRLLFQDSDGDISSILPLLVDAGLNVTSPCEPVGGMDIVKLRARFGSSLAFIGGLDKHSLLHGRDAIDKDLEYRIPPIVRGGGCLFGLDHRIPNGIKIEDYRYYVSKAWEILDRASSSCRPGD